MAISSGGTLRATTVCKAVMMLAAATMLSELRRGSAPWPPTPRTVMVT
jgi:hypothetical protein